jgi:hypothetical protein
MKKLLTGSLLAEHSENMADYLISPIKHDAAFSTFHHIKYKKRKVENYLA